MELFLGETFGREKKSLFPKKFIPVSRLGESVCVEYEGFARSELMLVGLVGDNGKPQGGRGRVVEDAAFTPAEEGGRMSGPRYLHCARFWLDDYEESRRSPRLGWVQAHDLVDGVEYEPR